MEKTIKINEKNYSNFIKTKLSIEIEKISTVYQKNSIIFCWEEVSLIFFLII
jgi:hypothetical protein